MGAAEWAGLFGGLGRGLEGFGEHLRYQDERKQQRALEALRQQQIEQQMRFGEDEAGRSAQRFAQDQEQGALQLQSMRDTRGFAAAKATPIGEDFSSAALEMMRGTPAEGYIKSTPAGGEAPETTELPPWLQQVAGTSMPGMLPAMTANPRETRRTMTDEKFTIDQIRSQIAAQEAARRANEGVARTADASRRTDILGQAEARKAQQGQQLLAIRSAAEARGDRALAQAATIAEANLKLGLGNLQTRQALALRDPFTGELADQGQQSFEAGVGSAEDLDRFINSAIRTLQAPAGAGPRTPTAAPPTAGAPPAAEPLAGPTRPPQELASAAQRVWSAAGGDLAKATADLDAATSLSPGDKALARRMLQRLATVGR